MKIKYLSTLAVVSLLGFGVVAACANPCAAKTQPEGTEATEAVDPCASKANPCASKDNPCASKANPCASKDNPCASKANPCASKDNPCASKANPCASKANPCASKSTSQMNIFTENGVAIRGTDPVAYFQENQPIAGSAEFAYEWGGATWHFASAENRDLFADNPEAYAPQYGGYCAWAVAQGYLAEIDPNAWNIVDGKLYLNFDRRIQRKWEKDIAGFITQANENWAQGVS